MPTYLHRRLLCAAGAAGLTLLGAPALPGQQPQAMQHQSWSTEAGLPQSSVHQILQSRDGYLWLATEGGVVRYDGVAFTVLSHDTDPNFTSDDITSLAQDGAGNLWFGTSDGLIERTQDRTRRFGEADGMVGESVSSLSLAKDGRLLARTASGAVIFNGSRFERVSSAGQEDMAFRGRSSAANGLTWMWDKSEVVATSARGRSVWRIGDKLPGARIQAAFVDRRGVAWIGTNRGLVSLTEGASQPVPIAALGINSVLAILEDAEGDLWVGTEASGLHVLRPRKFRDESQLADEEVSCVVQGSDGAMWIGTRDDGLRRVRADGTARVERPAPAGALTSPVILSLAAGLRGDVWVGTPDGLNHVEVNGRTARYTSSDGLADDLVRSLLVARDGTVWIGTRHGLTHFAEGHFETLSAASGLGSDLIGALYEFPRAAQAETQGLWVATYAGLSRLHDGTVTNFSHRDGLMSSLVTGMAADGAGRLWVTTRDAGLFRFERARFARVIANELQRELEGVTADGRGFLWLRAPRGLIRASADELAACSSGTQCGVKLAGYGVQDGMPSDEVVRGGEPSASTTRAGELWFATRKGVAIVDPSTLRVNTVAPPVVVERFSADSDQLSLHDSEQRIASRYKRYTFDFAGMSFVAPSKVLYRFKLEGFDRDWSAPSGRRSATYTNLPPGTYVFRVRAANNDGVWNDQGAAVRFRVLPPIYKRWWFVVAVVMGLVVIVLALYRVRVRRLQRAFDSVLGERNRIAREIHDTLAQDLVGVSLQLNVVSRLLEAGSVSGALQQVKATRGFVQQGLEQARQSIWNLRANTAHDSLPSRVNALMKRFSRDSLAVKTSIGGAYRAVPAGVEEEVLRILQEALSNVERHAGASSANVQLTYGEDKLVLIVDDSGHGFSVADAERKMGHFGLRGIRERAASIGAQLHITSDDRDGTRVKLIVPISGRKG